MTPYAIFALAVPVISACLRMGREMTDGSTTPDWMSGMRGAQLFGGRLLANWLLALPLAVGIQLRPPEGAGHWLDQLPGLSAFLLCGSAIVLFLLLSLGIRKENGGQEDGSDLLRGAALTCLCLWVGVIIVKNLPAPAVFGCYMAGAFLWLCRQTREPA